MLVFKIGLSGLNLACLKCRYVLCKPSLLYLVQENQQHCGCCCFTYLFVRVIDEESRVHEMSNKSIFRALRAKISCRGVATEPAVHPQILSVREAKF